MADSNICRVCLLPCSKHCFSLFADEREINIYLRIMACSSVQIKREDGYPTTICPECYTMLNTAYDFKRKCEASDFKLRNGLQIKIFKQENNDDDDNTFDVHFDNDNLSDISIKKSPAYEEPEIEIKPYLDYDDSDLTPLSALVDPKKLRKWKGHQKPSTKKKVKKKDVECKEEIQEMTVNNIDNIYLDTVEVKADVDAFDDDDFYWAETPMEDDETRQQKQKDLIAKVRKKNRDLRIAKVKKVSDEIEHLCDICGSMFKNRNHLLNHILIKHSEVEGGPYKCKDPNCTKTFKVIHYMTRHLKRCHSGKKEFVCNECGKQYVFISSLKQHMKVHTGNLAMKSCSFCHQKYKTQKSVDIHIRSVHTGERPAICTTCDSAFFHEDYLKEHVRLHTGETPFKCPVCKRGYAQRGNMKSHMKQHRLSELDEATKASMKPNYLKLLRDC